MSTVNDAIRSAQQAAIQQLQKSGGASWLSDSAQSNQSDSSARGNAQGEDSGSKNRKSE
jgi:hypothetical protein